MKNDFVKEQFADKSLYRGRPANSGNYHPRQLSSMTILALVMTAFCCLSLFSGCGESELEDFAQPVAQKHSRSRGVYPKTQGATRSSDFGFWESWNYITLSSGQKVNAPWNGKAVTSTAPHDILEDVKYDDGWDLIFYQLDDIKGKDHRENSPYLIFHNRYTGILKGFCYMSPTSFSPNNHGIWQISMNQPTSLFAFQNTPISRISEKKNEVYNVSNITDNASHGFSIGWNCFQIELAYDPDQFGWLQISTLASNSVEISLTGNLEAETSGLITTSQGKSNYGSGIAKVAGNEAGKWIKNKLDDKTILGIPASVVSEGVKAIVSGGVGSIIGAVTGLFKKDNTSTKSLQLTTNGKFTCKGSATFTSTTGIEPIEINFDPDTLGYYLGVWGLKDEPTLLFSPYAVRNSPQEFYDDYTTEYRVDIINSHSARPSVLINPELNKFVKSRSVGIDYYQTNYDTRKNIWGISGTYGRDPRYFGSYIYEGLRKPTFYMIAPVAFKGDEDQYLFVDQYEAPMEVFIPKVPGGPEGAIKSLIYNSRFIASIGVELILPDGSEAYSYHQCAPKLDWDLSQYDNGLYWSFYPCVPVTQINSNGYNAKPIDLRTDRSKMEKNIDAAIPESSVGADVTQNRHGIDGKKRK